MMRVGENDSRFSGIWNNGELPNPESVVVTSIVEEIWDTYAEEIKSLLQDLERAAMALESSDNNDKNIAEIKRLLHTIKGSSGMAGIADAHDLCHELESAMDQLLEQNALPDALLRCKDWIESAIDCFSADNVASKNESEQNNEPAKALIVDDDTVCRKRMEMILKDYFNCTFACNGKEGFDAYKQAMAQGEPYKLVTLDINMPEMDGHETLEAIREFEEGKNIQGAGGAKVIMATSESTSDHVFSAFRQGCEAYVVKNDMGEKLLDEIAKLGLLKVVNVQKTYALD